MTNNLDLRLREAGDHLHLDAPVSDVLSRGARIRRHRQRVRIAATGGVLAATAGIATIVLPTGASPLPAAEAGWGAAMVNLSDADLTDAQATCAAMLSAAGYDVPAGAAPVAGDSREGTTVLVYRVGDVVDSCSLREGTEGFVTQGKWDTIPAGQHLRYVVGGGAYLLRISEEFRKELEDKIGEKIPESDVTGTVRVMRVSDQVSDVVLHVAGHDVQATVADGLAVSWLPEGSTPEDLLDATVTAYAEDGTELETASLNMPFNPPPGFDFYDDADLPAEGTEDLPTEGTEDLPTEGTEDLPAEGAEDLPADD